MPATFTDPTAAEQQRLGLPDVSARLISGTRGWDQLKELLEPRRHNISAAIAYIGSSAAHWLPVASGSSLITNASLESVRSGTTDPNVLLKWAQAGVRVYSLNTLHAKLILAAGIAPFAIVGSANASSSSAEVLQEAVLISDGPDVIEDANAAMVGWKQLATRLTVQAIEALIPEFSKRPRRPNQKTPEPPDSGPDPTPAPWPRPTDVYIIRTTSADDVSEEAKATLERLRDENSIADEVTIQPGDLDLDMFYLQLPPDSDPSDYWKYQEGAHVVIVLADRANRVRQTSWVTEPGRVLHVYSDPGARPPRTYYYVLCKTSAEDHRFTELTQALAAVGETLEEDRHYIDIEAVTAGLTQEYNSGAVEGTVNKIKARKMQLFGRAKHDLLRKLILLS